MLKLIFCLGAHLSPCCGCHRYDQSALTAITSFFFGYPKNALESFAANSFSPPFTSNKGVDFFDVIRGQQLASAYFV